MKRTAALLVLLTATCAVIAGDSPGAASSYPTPLKLTSTTSAVTGSWKLGSSTGSADSTTSNVPAQSATGWYAFDPGTSSTTQIASLPTTPDGKGWIIDPAGGATGFPAGTWSFTVKTDIPDATLVAGAAVLTVGIWKGTFSGGAFTSTGTILTPTDDAAAQNLRTSASEVTTTVSFSVAKFSIAAGETLYVDLWRRQTAGVDSATAAQREVDLVVNDGVTQVAHPAADDTGPTHALTITAISGSTYYDSGTRTLYYNGGSAGSFKVNDAIADGGAGPYSVNYPLLSTSGWTHANETVTTGSSYQSSAYSWAAGSTTSPGAQTITGEDGALQTSTTTLTLTSDTAAPSGQTVSLSGGPWYTSLSVPLTLSSGSDSGSGVDTATGVVERASALLSNGTCGTFGSFAAVTLTGGADASAASGSCYRYQYKASDRVGNLSSASAASGDAKVDATPPTTPGLFFAGLLNASATGSTVYYRPGAAGRLTIAAAASDPESGVAGYTFPTIAGFASAGVGSKRTYTFTGTPPQPTGPQGVTATNTAGLASAAASFALAADSAAPAVTVRCNGVSCSTKTYPKAVTVTLTATDNGSGVREIRYTTNGAVPTEEAGEEYQHAFAIRVPTRLKVRAYDKVGNASKVVTRSVSSLADQLVFSAPPAISVRSGARHLRARLSASARVTVTATMTGPGLKRPERWRFSMGAGAAIVQLRLPASLPRSGRYTIAWKAQAGEKTASRTTKVVLGLPRASKKA